MSRDIQAIADHLASAMYGTWMFIPSNDDYIIGYQGNTLRTPNAPKTNLAINLPCAGIKLKGNIAEIIPYGDFSCTMPVDLADPKALQEIVRLLTWIHDCTNMSVSFGWATKKDRLIKEANSGLLPIMILTSAMLLASIVFVIVSWSVNSEHWLAHLFSLSPFFSMILCGGFTVLKSDRKRRKLLAEAEKMVEP